MRSSDWSADVCSSDLLVAADRRIGATGQPAVAGQQRLVESLAHAVQALELEIAALARPFEQRRDGQRIVGGKRRIEMRCIEHAPRTSEIGNVGCGLAGEELIAGEAVFLAVLALAVTVGALEDWTGVV